MNVIEANVFLTRAALLDGRFRRDAVEQADMAEEWSRVLHDIPVVTAMYALHAHYRTETRAITPADVVAHAEAHADDTTPTTTELREREQRDAWLRENGIDPAEWDRRVAAGQPPARILAELGIDLKGELTA